MVAVKDVAFSAFTGGKDRSLATRLNEGAVNVADMDGFVGNGVADDLAPLQAAVAKALSEGKGSVIIPAGARCAISDTLGLWYEADQTNPAFSLALVSVGPHGNHNSQGAYIKPTFDGTALMVGPGQEMLVENIAVIDTGAAYRGLQSSSRVGIGISGGSGGASGWSLNNCHVYGMHTAVKAGLVDASLCDSGFMQKLNIDQCAVGVDFISSQNYIQTLLGCTITAGISVKAAVGHNINIFGGNLSTSSGRAGKYTLSSVSALTVTDVYTFTAHVDDPDSNLEAGLFIDGAMNLPQFGIVPVTVTNYNVGTQVITLQILPMWAKANYYDVNLKTGTNFDTINQANTYLALAERVTTLYGTGFNVQQIHVENASAYSRLLECDAGFDAGSHITRIDGLHCNWDVGLPVDGDADLQVAKRLIQKSHPFVNLVGGSAIIENARFSQAGNASITFDILNSQQLEVRNWRNLRPPNVRYTNSQDPFTGGGFESVNASGTGAGVWMPTPFVPAVTDSSITQRQAGWNKTEYWGWFPAKDRSPRLAPSQVTTLSGTLPTFTTGSNTGYPLLCGGTSYSIGSEVGSNSGADFLLRSDHKGFSYGQNLTTTNVTNLAWSFYGTTTKLVLNAEAFGRVFPGLVLSLSHASINGGTPFEVIITAIFKDDLYVTVMALSGYKLPGTADTQYTGTTIGQAAYSITTI